MRHVDYREQPPRMIGPNALVPPRSNLPILLSQKSDHWRYEDEWRLIVELNQTIGTGETGPLGQPVNLVRVPNEAVVSVYYTERTPPGCVDLIRQRLSDNNNRYRAETPRKLIMSTTSYGYEEAADEPEP